MRRYYVILLAFLALVGCKDDDPVTPDRGRTYLHIVNGAEVDSFNVVFDYYNADDVVIDNFYWQRNFPISGYADMEAGGTPDDFGNGKLYFSVSRQPFANVAPDTLMEPVEIVLERDEYSTLCLADSFGQIVSVKFVDDITINDDTTALIRFINLSSSASSAELRTASGSLSIPAVPFLEASPFTGTRSGTLTFEAADTTGTISSQNVYLPGGKAYTFYLSGSSLALDYFEH